LGKQADSIRLRGMAFFGHHGVDPDERRLGKKFFLDVELALDLRAAGRADDLARTVDYSRVYAVVSRVQQSRQFLLLEGLVEAVAQAILAEFPVTSVNVRVRKPEVPLGGVLEHVEVEITRTRDDLAPAKEGP